MNPQLIGTICFGVLGILSVLWMFWDGPYSREIPRDRPGKYMTRHSLRYMDPEKGGGPWRAYLHQFFGPDDEGHHNHPSRWSFSIVLLGSYVEERLYTFKDLDGGIDVVRVIERRHVKWFNFLSSEDYHRIVELQPRKPGGCVWTLFFCGPLTKRSWGFMIPGRGHVDFQIRKVEKRAAALAARAGQQS